MENNIFAPCTQNKKGRILFYIFEIAAAAFFAIYFIMAIVDAARYSSFQLFLNGFLTGTFYLFVLYGMGKVIDLLSCKHDCKADKEAKTKKEDKAENE